MTSSKVKAIRDAWANELAQRGEPAPVSPEDRLARALRARSDGLTLSDARRVLLGLGKERADEALASVRRAAWVVESREVRPNAAGKPQAQVVLRARAAGEGSVRAGGGD